MKERKKNSPHPCNGQAPRFYAAPARKREANKTNAVADLQRAARRCSRCFGAQCVSALLELVRKELGDAQ